MGHYNDLIVTKGIAKRMAKRLTALMNNPELTDTTLAAFAEPHTAKSRAASRKAKCKEHPVYGLDLEDVREFVEFLHNAPDGFRELCCIPAGKRGADYYSADTCKRLLKKVKL